MSDLVDAGTKDSELLDIIDKSVSINNVYAVNHPIETAYLEEIDQATATDFSRDAISQRLSEYLTRWENEADMYAEMILDRMKDDPNIQASFATYWNYKNNGIIDQFYNDIAFRLSGENNSIRALSFQLDMRRMNAMELIRLYGRMQKGS
jgi:hypothetical protein